MNCDLCIHKDVCHAVAECLTEIPGFDCHSFGADMREEGDENTQKHYGFRKKF